MGEFGGREEDVEIVTMMETCVGGFTHCYVVVAVRCFNNGHMDVPVVNGLRSYGCT